MLAIEKKVNISSLAEFTYEEHADDISLIVHRYIGRDPEAISQFFKLFISSTDLQTCEKFIESDIIPPMGSFADEHVLQNCSFSPIE